MVPRPSGHSGAYQQLAVERRDCNQVVCRFPRLPLALQRVVVSDGRVDLGVFDTVTGVNANAGTVVGGHHFGP